MMDVTRFRNMPLRGGFVIGGVRLVPGPLTDSIGRPALALTRITAGRFEIDLLAHQTDEELSVSLYHEVLEAAAVAANECPPRVLDFNESAFERAARVAQSQLGPVSPERLNALLEQFGF